MFLRINKISNIEAFLDTYYKLYKIKIMQLVNNIIKEENIWNRSNKQYVLNQFFYIFALISLLYNEYTRNLNTDWNYYIEKYNLSSVRSKIKCYGINLDEILSIFGLPNISVSSKGIGRTSIQSSLIVGAELEEQVVNEVELFDIYLPLVQDECVLNIENTCNYIVAKELIPIISTQEDLILINNELIGEDSGNTIISYQNNCY